VVQRTQIMIPSDERHRQAVQRELATFEKLENDFNARERKKRAARLGLVLGNYSYSPKETSNPLVSLMPRTNEILNSSVV